LRARNPPIAPLVIREVRALFSTSAPWILLGAAGPLATMEPLLATFVLPIVVARAFAKTSEQPLVLQMGYRGASLAFAKAFAVSLAWMLATIVVAAITLPHVPFVVGSALYALVIIGLGAALQGRLFATWGVAGALWLLVENARWRGDVVGVMAKHAPSSLMAPFTDGVLDLGAGLQLFTLGVGLLAMNAALAPAPSEKQLRRAIVVAVVFVVAFLAATRVRWTDDASLAALANVKDPVRIEMRMDPREARRLERSLSDVRITFGDANVVEVAGRKATSNARDVVPTILELAGQPRATLQPMRVTTSKANPFAPWIAFVIAPAIALLFGAILLRRRA
jgi:hypothetical protein